MTSYLIPVVTVDISESVSENQTEVIIGYEISYTYIGPCNSQTQDNTTVSLPVNTTQYALTELQVGSIYIVTLTSITNTTERSVLFSVTATTPYGSKSVLHEYVYRETPWHYI